MAKVKAVKEEQVSEAEIAATCLKLMRSGRFNQGRDAAKRLMDELYVEYSSVDRYAVRKAVKSICETMQRND